MVDIFSLQGHTHWLLYNLKKQKVEDMALEYCSLRLRNILLSIIHLFIIYGFLCSITKDTSWLVVHGEKTKSCLFIFSLWIPNNRASHRRLGLCSKAFSNKCGCFVCPLIISFVKVLSS